jgi:alpha/beta hydrolase fold
MRGRIFQSRLTDAGESGVMNFKISDVAGIRLFYREAGHPSKPTIVLLHGFPSSSYQFQDLIPRLADRFHVIAPDYPGMGYSEADTRSGVRRRSPEQELPVIELKYVCSVGIWNRCSIQLCGLGNRHVSVHLAGAWRPIASGRTSARSCATTDNDVLRGRTHDVHRSKSPHAVVAGRRGVHRRRRAGLSGSYGSLSNNAEEKEWVPSTSTNS